MKRLAYITDTHFGSGEGAWGQQPTYPNLVPELFKDLANYLRNHPVDFLLHGGDLTDSGSEEQQKGACEIAKQLPCPFFLTLGNHDLNTPNALKVWQNKKDVFFGSDATSTCDFIVDLGSATLIGITNTWQDPSCDTAFCWDRELYQLAGITDEQYLWLESQIKDKPVILSLHETLHPLPPRLTGMDEPIHNPPGPYVDKLTEFVENHPQIKLVLSGHCHATCRTNQNGTTHLTTAAFFEPPFQIRVIEVDDAEINVTTAYPIDLKKYSVAINEDKLWSAGKWYDWRITVKIGQ